MAGRLSSLTREELQYVFDTFILADIDANGQVTRPELEKCLRMKYHNMEEGAKNHYLKYKEDFIDFYLKFLDLNENGMIEFTEFVTMYSLLKSSENQNKEKITQIFKGLDKNKDGTISYSEWVLFCKLFNPNSPDSCNSASALGFQRTVSKQFDMIDTNSDGRIDYNEFINNYDKNNSICF